MKEKLYRVFGGKGGEEQAEKDRWWTPCSGCKDGHPSFWKTVVESKEWQDWEKVANKKGFDCDESRECGWFSPQHFRAFLDSICGSKEGLKGERNRIIHQEVKRAVNEERKRIVKQLKDEIEEYVDWGNELSTGEEVKDDILAFIDKFNDKNTRISKRE